MSPDREPRVSDERLDSICMCPCPEGSAANDEIDRLRTENRELREALREVVNNAGEPLESPASLIEPSHVTVQRAGFFGRILREVRLERALDEPSLSPSPISFEVTMSKIRLFVRSENIEAEALAQAHQTASMPFVQGLAVMPDVHWGRGSTVGTVVATRGAVMPACVGVDIGCGMIAVRTNLDVNKVREKAQQIHDGIERRIPTGKHTNGSLRPSATPRVEELLTRMAKHKYEPGGMKYNKWDKNWPLALGTLGGGNHFIEICEGTDLTTPEQEEPWAWIILHSGSRGIGNKIGTYYTNVAKNLSRKYMYASWLPHEDLAYLHEHTEEFWRYMEDLHWAQEFARLNREEMMDRVLTELIYTLALDLDPIHSAIGLEVERINCHHNFTQREHHDGENVIITRKGAIEARQGMPALIPGSMGSHSYVVDGLGCEGAYHSAPHGAGRRLSRNKARKQFTLADVQHSMEGIASRSRESIVDEYKDAYKDLDQVMEDAKLLIRPRWRLTPFLNVKGD